MRDGSGAIHFPHFTDYPHHVGFLPSHSSHRCLKSLAPPWLSRGKQFQRSRYVKVVVVAGYVILFMKITALEVFTPVRSCSGMKA